MRYRVNSSHRRLWVAISLIGGASLLFWLVIRSGGWHNDGSTGSDQEVISSREKNAFDHLDTDRIGDPVKIGTGSSRALPAPNSVKAHDLFHAFPSEDEVITALLSSPQELADFINSRPADAGLNFVMIRLSPIIDKYPVEIEKLIHSLAVFDDPNSPCARAKLTTDLVRKQAHEHSGNLVSWIEQLSMDDQHFSSLFLKARISIIGNSADPDRWQKATDVLNQLAARDTSEFESLQSEMLVELLKTNVETAISWMGNYGADADNAQSLVNVVASYLAEHDPPRADAFVEQIHDEKLRDLARRVIDGTRESMKAK